MTPYSKRCRTLIERFSSLWIRPCLGIIVDAFWNNQVTSNDTGLGLPLSTHNLHTSKRSQKMIIFGNSCITYSKFPRGSISITHIMWTNFYILICNCIIVYKEIFSAHLKFLRILRKFSKSRVYHSSYSQGLGKSRGVETLMTQGTERCSHFHQQVDLASIISLLGKPAGVGETSCCNCGCVDALTLNNIFNRRQNANSLTLRKKTAHQSNT